jgi:hypothetical protein
MPLEGHWARQQAPLRARERRVVLGVVTTVVAAIVVLVLVVGRGSSSPGCVDATIASTTGGAAVHACGSRARALCSARDATAEIRTACARAGLTPSRR